MKVALFMSRVSCSDHGGASIRRRRVRRAMGAGEWRPASRARLGRAGMRRHGRRGCGHVARPPRLQDRSAGRRRRRQVRRHPAVRQPQLPRLPWPYYRYTLDSFKAIAIMINKHSISSSFWKYARYRSNFLSYLSPKPVTLALKWG